jgi:hypothetical protein
MYNQNSKDCHTNILINYWVQEIEIYSKKHNFVFLKTNIGMHDHDYVKVLTSFFYHANCQLYIALSANMWEL